MFTIQLYNRGHNLNDDDDVYIVSSNLPKTVGYLSFRRHELFELIQTLLSIEELQP